MFKRIFFGYLTVLLISFAILAVAFSFTVRQYLVNDTIASLQRVAETLSGADLSQNAQGGRHMRGAFFSQANRIAYADYIIIQENGLIISSSDEEEYPPGESLSENAFFDLAFSPDLDNRLVTGNCIAVSYPLAPDGRQNRAALILYSQPDLLLQLNRALLGILALSLLAGIAASLAGGFFASRLIVKPLNQLKSRALELSRRRFRGRLSIKTGDELEELAESFNEMSDRLAAYDQGQKEFFQKASHELKTPLMSVQGYAEAIRDGIIPPRETERSLEVIIRESQRMKGLVDQLIYLSKVETLEDDFKPGTLELVEAVEEAVEALRSLALEKNLELEIKSSGMSKKITGDSEQLHRLLLNTIGNAIRYAKQSVAVTVKENLIIIEDDGPGFQPGEEEKAFNPFYSGNSQGSGLGLAISRAIVNKHGGTITAGNRPGGGGRITIYLPGCK
jgi:signal transduction histidine kinase